MNATRILLWSLLVSSLIPAGAHAQTLRAQVVEEINAAAKARARLRGGSWVTVYAPTADSTSLRYERSEFLTRGGSRVEIAPPLMVTQLEHIQVSRGSHAGTGARIGGSVMGVLTILAIISCQNTICEPTSGEALGALVAWTAIGAGIGALIGSGSPRWETVY